MDFPLIDLMDEDPCYQRLVDWLHPDGLSCPRCHRREGLHIHRRDRDPVLDYRCYHCGRVFNTFTGTSLHGIRRRPSELVLILRGIAQGTPTAQLARELDCDGAELLRLRHRLQDLAYWQLDPLPLEGSVAEADEMYQNAGEKGVPHTDPDDPPRRRANQARGHGTWDHDRPPVCGVVERGGGPLRLRVVEHAAGATLQEFVRRQTWPGTVVHTGDWSGYNRLPRSVVVTPRCATRQASGRAMVMATECVRCITTRKRGSGRDCGTSCAYSGASARSTCISMWGSSSGATT